MNRLSCTDVLPLIADLLVSDLAPEQVSALGDHLQDCPACRKMAEALLMQDRLLAEMAGQTLAADMASRFRQAAESLPPLQTPKPQGRIRFPIAWRWVAAAAVLLVIVGGVLFRREPETPEVIPAVARLEQVSGEVYVVGKNRRTTARAGQNLFPGERVHVGEEGTAVVSLPDSSWLDLGPTTSLSWPSVPAKEAPDQSGNRINLDEGSLVAHLLPEANREPMVLVTPHAEVVVGKTRFSLWNEANATHIELEEGTAQVIRRSDGKPFTMDALRGGAEIGRDVPFEPHKLSPRLREARKRFDDHAGGVTNLAIGNEGRSMLVGCKSGQVKVWDLDSGKERTSFSTGLTPLRGMALVPLGDTLITGHEKTFRFWDTVTGLERFMGHRPMSGIYAIGFSNEKTALTASFDRVIRRWDLTTGKLSGSLRCKDYQSNFDYPACMTFSNDGGQLAWGMKDNTARIWDTAAAKQLHVLQGHEDAVTATAFSPDGLLLATGSRDRSVKLWDLSSGTLRATLRGHRHTVLALAFSPDGRSLASGGSDTMVNLWDVVGGKVLGTLKGHVKAVQVVAFMPDGRFLVTGSEDESVRVWDLP